MDEIGRKGEDLAVKYLKDLKWKILFRNYREPEGELDIVAEARDKTLVLVEVKSMGSNFQDLVPEDNMTSAKKKKFARIAEMFVAKHPDLVDVKKGWRLDLITILFCNDNPKLVHYENVV